MDNEFSLIFREAVDVETSQEAKKWVEFFRTVLTSEKLKNAMKKIEATHLGLFPRISFLKPSRINHYLHIELSYDHYSRIGLRIYETGKNAVPMPEQYDFDKSWERTTKSDKWKEFVSYGDRPLVGDVSDESAGAFLNRVGAIIPDIDGIIRHWEKITSQ